ncbi:MAG TPA: hypothetical protein VGK16_05415 [Candidatus Limnocylindrales bacterium]|jgi:hypothetical protein
MAYDEAGNLYVADSGNRKIRKITPAGLVSTFAGSGASGALDGPGPEASFAYPQDLAYHGGDLYVADAYNNKIRKISSDGVVSTFAGSGTGASIDGTGTDASFNVPVGLEFDAVGNLFVSDGSGDKIRKITPDAVVTTFAGSGVEGATDATGAAASFYVPAGLAFDGSGNLFVGDSANNKIRKITPEAVVTTFVGSGAAGATDAAGVAASFKSPQSLTFDGLGNLYVTDVLNNKIRKITPEGVVTTFAGSGSAGATDASGTAASLSRPIGLVMDNAGDLFVGDGSNNKIRRITDGAVVTTFAGSGDSGSTDDSSAGSASTSDGSVTVQDRHCYRLALTLTDRAAGIATYTSPSVVVERPAPTATLACTPDDGPTKLASIGCTATFSESPGQDSIFDSQDVVIGGDATGWAVNGLIGSGSGPYAFDVEGGVDGSLSVAIAGGAIVDSDGRDTTASETLTWTIDRKAPSTSSLSVKPRAGSALSGSSIPLALTWSGSDNSGGSGIARYELARSTNGGSWTSVSTSLTAKSASVTAASSGTVRHRVRAVDKAGNGGAWTYGSTISPRLTQQWSSAVRYATTWALGRSSSYSGGSVRYAKTAGRSVSYMFTGRSIALVTSKSVSRGKVKIYVNGVYQTTVDTYRSSSQYRVVAWQKTWSTSGTRTIKLVVRGTSGRPRVDLDAFVVVK